MERGIFFKPSEELRKLIENAPRTRAYLDKYVRDFYPANHAKDFQEAFEPFIKEDLPLGKALGGRSRAHIARLGRTDHNLARLFEDYPQDVQKQFAMDFMSHFGRTLRMRARHEVMRALSSEGHSVNYFWTFAPYIHSKLKGRVGARKSISILMNWAKDSLQRDENGHNELGHLAGLHIFDRDQAFELERHPKIKPNTITAHMVAAQLAREFSEILLKEYGK